MNTLSAGLGWFSLCRFFLNVDHVVSKFWSKPLFSRNLLPRCTLTDVMVPRECDSCDVDLINKCSIRITETVKRSISPCFIHGYRGNCRYEIDIETYFSESFPWLTLRTASSIHLKSFWAFRTFSRNLFNAALSLFLVFFDFTSRRSPFFTYERNTR